MYTGADQFKIHDVKTLMLHQFDRNMNGYQLTQVTIYIGDHGPFTQLFGQGQAYPDTIESIQAWKAQMVTKVQQTVQG